MSVMVSVGEIVYILAAVVVLFWIYFMAAGFLVKQKIPRTWETGLCWLIGAGG